MTQPGGGQPPFIPRNGQPPPQMDGRFNPRYPQPFPVGPPPGGYAQPGEGNWGNPRYMDPRVDAQLAWDAFVADEEANQREYDEAQGVPSLESLQGNYARGLKLNELMGKIPNINPFMGGAMSGILDMGQAHAAREYAKGLQRQFEQDYLNEAMTDEGQDRIEDFLQSQLEPVGFNPTGYVRTEAPSWSSGITPDVQLTPPPVPPLLAGGTNINPPSSVQDPSQWTNIPGLPPAQATVRQMAQDYGGQFESPAMAARREEFQRAAEEIADQEEYDRMREEEEARIQEALEELARSSDYATQGTVADYF